MTAKIVNRKFDKQMVPKNPGPGLLHQAPTFVPEMSTGCQWRALPKDLPPRSTVHDYLGLWNWDGTLDRIHHALYLKCREKAAREASPTACIIDSQSVKSAEKGGLASTATASMPAS